MAGSHHFLFCLLFLRGLSALLGVIIFEALISLAERVLLRSGLCRKVRGPG